MTKGKEVWWRLYRLKQLRQQKKTNLTTAIRRILKQCFWEYISNCSIGGVRQMSDPDKPLRRRIFWAMIFCGMFMIFFYFFWYLWFENLSKPMIVSLETSTYPISELDFPAVAICNVNRISKKALYFMEENVFKNKVDKDLKQTSTWQLGGLLDYTYNVSRVLNYIRIVDSAHKHADKVAGTMKKLAPSCDEMLLECMWAGVRVDCKKIFTIRRTFRGHCCAFNYVLDYDAAGAPNSTISIPKRQLRSGKFNGLNLLVDPLIEDYAYTTRSVPGIEVLIFDAKHYADLNGGRMIQRIAEPNKAMYLELKSVKQVATNEVRKYALQTRKCMFHDEKKEKFNDMYSYNACITNCRITTMQTICKCTPYFMPTPSSSLLCTLQQLPCLNKHKEKFLNIYPIDSKRKDSLEIEFQDSLYCPDCYPDCEYLMHCPKDYQIKIPKIHEQNFSKRIFAFDTDINLTNKCYISVYQSSLYGTLQSLDVVSYWYELISDVGGVGGILIALSIFCILEFVYFFIVKFISEICNLFLNKI